MCASNLTEQAATGHGQATADGRRQVVVVPESRSRTATWIIAVCLLVIASCLVLRPDPLVTSVATAQPVAASGARGIFAFTGQLSKTSYGVFMVDVDTSTIWCYEVDPEKPLLKFVAARSWKYDRYLEEFNIDPDTAPAIVEELVEQQRQRRLESVGAS